MILCSSSERLHSPFSSSSNVANVELVIGGKLVVAQPERINSKSSAIFINTLTMEVAKKF
jgi:hypothetical protein